MIRILICLVAVLCMVTGVAAQAATSSTPQAITVTIDAKDQDVRETLRNLFTKANASYTLNPNVQGKVNLSLVNIPFEEALKQILDQADATYRFEGGIYKVIPRVQSLDPLKPVDEVGIRIVDVEVAEALKRLPGEEIIEIAPGVSGQVTVVGDLDSQATLNEIARQVDARVVRTDSGYRLIPMYSLRKRVPVLRYTDGDLRKIVVDLLNQAGVNYIVSGGIVGKTTVNIVDTDVQTALEALLQPIGGKITLRKGVFIVSAK